MDGREETRGRSKTEISKERGAPPWPLSLPGPWRPEDIKKGSNQNKERMEVVPYFLDFPFPLSLPLPLPFSGPSFSTAW